MLKLIGGLLVAIVIMYLYLVTIELIIPRTPMKDAFLLHEHRAMIEDLTNSR